MVDARGLDQVARQLIGPGSVILNRGYCQLVETLANDKELRAVAAAHGPAAVVDADTPAIQELKKQNKEFVTQGERDAELEMRCILSQHLPDHSQTGEEHGSSNDGSDWLWVFDPVDGTSAMIRTAIAQAFEVPLEEPRPRFGISIGVVHGDEPVYGLIAELEANGKGISVTNVWAGGIGLAAPPLPVAPPMSQAVLACTVPEMMFCNFQKWSQFQALLDAAGKFVPDQNCIGFMHLLAGETHVVVERDLTLPDSAAFVPILKSAGFKVTDHNGNPLRFDKTARDGEYLVWVAHPALHEEALKLFTNGVSKDLNRFDSSLGNHGYGKKFEGGES